MKRVYSSLSTRHVLVAILFALFSITQLNAQQVIRCATTYVDSIRHAENPNLQTNDEFEEWLQKEIMHKKNAPKTKVNINGVYYIPIVVHVVHNGEAIGTGTNLSVATIQSQIDVLNEDFRRISGTNGFNSHPDGADTEIEFCLAKRRPDGTAFPPGEDGINRINRNTAGFTAPPYATAYINGTIKPYTTTTGPLAWDASVYMNFWSMDLSGGLLGYAQFPTTVLGGMDCGSQSASTDGVVMLYSSIGKSAVTGNGGVYNEGRTATHEIGHWMGLRHIWGDGGCGVDDYCLDTPESDAANYGCPSGHVSCSSTDMIENYMDYTDDLCMNIFTNDQKMRMRTVMESSTIRASLINSDACTPPAVSDASIINILSPFGDNCPGSITPTVTLRNRGSSNLTSATIEYTIDGGTPVSFNWTGSIAPGAEANINLPAFTATLGNHTIQAYSLLPNGVTDPDPTFDTTTLLFAISNGIAPNYTQDFDGGVFAPDLRWSVVNPNSDCYEWVGGTGVSSTGVTNNATALMTNFGNASGQEEYLYTPIFILPCNATAAQMDFDVAYRRRTTGSTDELRVEISEDCGATWSNIYTKSGNTLSTVTGTQNSYYAPTAAGEWRNEVEDLMAYVTGTSKSIQFRFIGNNNGNGGNIYVDNFNFTATTPGEINIVASGNDILDGGFYNYGTVAQGSTTTATFTIENTGTSDLILTGPITVSGSEFTLNSTFGTTTVPAGGTTTFSIDFNPVSAGNFTGSVSFGTNDCDEGTYNFELNGATNTSPPTAAFTGTPTTICQGSTVTYTDASSGASTWTWTFTGGTPSSATGVGPHTITYAAAGSYDAVLDVTNAFGSDNETQTNYVTVIGGTAAGLPISEGFTAATFPPANWSIVNGGNVITWERDAANGNAPTAGNSAFIDNFSTNTTGNIDDLVIEPADFSGLSSAQLEFDVAYARYNATFNDQLQVLVSDDCGQTYTVVYDKAGSVLATDPDQTGAYTPGTWRTETVDLSAFVGSNKVDVLFRNISGYGQFLFIDNINLTGVSAAATADFTATPDPACVGQTVTYTDASTGATSWDWDFGTGATPATASGVGPHTVTYASSGTIAVSLDVNSGTSVSNQNITINALDDASFNYSSAAFCATDSDPTATITGIAGGTFSSSPAGLSINASSGQVDLSASTPGSYTITYTTSGTCPNSSDVSLEVYPGATTPIVSASGATTFCAGGSVDLTSSEASGNVWSTSETTQTINITSSGSYSVSFTDGNGCTATSSPVVVTVNALPTAPTIAASGSTTICSGGSVDLTSSQASGNVWSTAETTQTINVTSAGTYSVTYTDGNGCSATSAPTTVTVNALPAAPVITPSGATTFCAGGSVDLVSSEISGNTWSTAETTGLITVSTSGSYSVTYTDGNGCSATSAPITVTVNPGATTPVVSASGPTTFCAGGSVDLTSSQASGNVWSTSETTQTINITSSGSYSVSYTDGNGCTATSVPVVVTVNALPSAPTIAASGSTTFCAGGSVDLTSSQASGNVWSTAETTQTINVTSAGTYSVTYTDGNGCSATSAPTTVTVNALPAAPVITPSGATTFCAGGSVDLVSSEISGNTWSTAETTGLITVSTSGSYSVTYTDGNGCSATSAPITVTVNPGATTPVVSASGPTTFCAGGSVDLTSSETSGNVWSTSETTQTINITSSGSYSVTYTDGNGCTATSVPVVVTVNALPSAPTITASGSTTFCDGGSVTLTSSEPTGNVWSTASTSNNIVVTTSGSYSVTYTDGNGCSATSAVTNVTVNPAPVIAVGSVIDPTACATSTGSIEITGSGTGNVGWTGTASGTSGVVTLPYTITGLAAGSYNIGFVDASTCASNVLNQSLTDPTPPSAPVVTASGATTFCDGGSVTLTSSELSGNTWSTSETTQSINVTTSGTYSVTYTNGSGCSASSTPVLVTVNANPTAPTITASGSTTICAGNSVSLTSSESTGIVWSTTETSQTITASAAGSYSVTYTDGNGCSSSSSPTSVIVNANPSTPAITASGSTTFCDGGSVDLVSSEISGNTWSTTETTGLITVSTNGVYNVTYTDGNGCSATSADVTVTVNPVPAITADAVNDPTTCGTSTGSITVGGTGTGFVSWTGSTSGTSGSVTLPYVISGLSAGSYAITFDQSGCVSNTLNEVLNDPTPPTAPTILASGPTTFCAGGSVDLTSSQASGNVWSTSETTQTINVTSSGTYSVTYTDGNGCSAVSTPITVTVNAAPTAPVVTASGSTTFCTGGSVDLTSSETSGNVWSTSETTQTITATTAGSYSVTYTDGNGCSATSAPVVVTINTAGPAPLVTTSGPTTFCAGGSVDLTSSELSGNVWSTSETTQSINVTTSGSYTVTYTDVNGCTGTSAPVVVTVNSAPTSPVISASGSTTFCAGGSVDLTSSQVSGNVWSTSETTQTINVTASGTYSVTYTDGNGCSAASAPITVTVNAAPSAPVITASGSTTFCAGGSVDLTSSETSGNVWSTSETTQTINVTTSGTYSVTYTDGNGCTASSTPISVIVNANPATPTISTSGPTTFCAGGSVDLTSSVVGGNDWSTSETTQTISVATSGSYTVTYIDGNGCSATSAPTTVTVNANPATPTITANSPTTFCQGGSVDLTSSQLTGNVWSTTQTSQVITVTTSGSYSVMHTDANGCSAISNPVNVIVNANPAIPTVTANGPLTFCANEDVDLSSSQTNGNTWSTTETTQTVSINLTGVYTVTYTDGNGCSATSSPVTVTVNPLPVITMDLFTDVCVEETAFTLTGATPAGGTYSGTGVSGGMFDPSVAGVGVHTIYYEYSNAIGCTNTAQVDVSVNDCASIGELENGGFNVYPNPTSSALNISSKFGSIDDIRVYDAAGRLVYLIQGVSENSKTIDMSEFSVGIYNIEVSTENNIYRTRVMKN